jgi:histone acetyltransferase SAS3
LIWRRYPARRIPLESTSLPLQFEPRLSNPLPVSYANALQQIKMAAAMLMEEELQNSMATSEEDAEFEEDDELGGDMAEDNADSYAANNQLHNGMMGRRNEGDESNGEEAILSDEDAEGEEDDEMVDSVPHNGEDDSQEEDDEDEDGEGVGAVKIQPGLLEDDEEAMSGTGTEDDDDESAASMDDESKDSTDNEVEVEWEPAAEEEEEPANPNRCMCVVPC